MVRRLCPRESCASEGLLYTHSRIYPTLSQKASSFPCVAGGSVPSQLEAFKFKTKQNNPFLGSFFPSSIFVKDPMSPERSGSQNPESKYISASSALLKLLGCSGEQAVFIVTFWGVQQISWPSGHNSQASSSKKKFWHVFKLSWGQSFLLTMDGTWGAGDWFLFDFLLVPCCWAPHLTEPWRGLHTRPLPYSILLGRELQWAQGSSNDASLI